MSKWQNFGDINFFAYGGCLVKPHFGESESELTDVFDVFYVNTEAGEKGNQNFAALCCIDLSDSWLHYDEMLTCCGYDEYVGMQLPELIVKLSPELLAKEMVCFEGVGNFCPSVVKNGQYIQYPCDDDYILSDEDVENMLKSIGAEEFLPENNESGAA